MGFARSRRALALALVALVALAANPASASTSADADAIDAGKTAPISRGAGGAPDVSRVVSRAPTAEDVESLLRGGAASSDAATAGASEPAHKPGETPAEVYVRDRGEAKRAREAKKAREEATIARIRANDAKEHSPTDVKGARGRGRVDAAATSGPIAQPVAPVTPPEPTEPTDDDGGGGGGGGGEWEAAAAAAAAAAVPETARPIAAAAAAVPETARPVAAAASDGPHDVTHDAETVAPAEEPTTAPAASDDEDEGPTPETAVPTERKRAARGSGRGHVITSDVFSQLEDAAERAEKAANATRSGHVG
ncbi:uncharacterized protein MICPUCDRAFT_63013 [Micromonas pusilla CCMP1545]|uniref:Predicted protein n=2 Tax=Micromonas pusilla TaxID=38833 RepID=C1N148_MICPC|nr:uncharacterized protein MICPUCDRAFT_63013 [Micromonas pusilla CCMP1545]EEH54379.1 predicted protein [Micromonas pusilla CCMP1545]|eukprot:XP_003061749.1 predicted protein [Micromonas pusilla CCMP1545]